MEVEEKVSCSVNKDGDLEKFEVKGIIYVTMNDPKKASPIAQLSFTPVKGFTFKAHPDLDKGAFTKNKII